jgi:hypothetical protein
MSTYTPVVVDMLVVNLASSALVMTNDVRDVFYHIGERRA